MPRIALYSSAPRPRQTVDAAAPEAPAPGRAGRRSGGFFRRALTRRRGATLLAAVLLAVLGTLAVERHFVPEQPALTQADIDRAVRTSLEKEPLPAAAARAYETILPSVVRVDGFDHPEGIGLLPKRNGPAEETPEKDKPQDRPSSERQSVGTGVVITDQGRILTNLHVVSGTSHVRIVFADGTESDAMVVGADPANDLAVLQAQKLPDDLRPATLVTTGDLRPGDAVLAVGFPFGFGPSASTGVVSGLGREFVSSDGRRALGNLIQFDAAANPGNSGGPLVNMQGEVLGIVTAILNPMRQRFFVGLAFAVPIENAASAVGVPPF